MDSDEIRAAVEEGQRLRGWIANGYAQVEYLLGDIILRAYSMQEYADLVGGLPLKVENRIKKVKEIIEINGFFSKYSENINDIIEEFEIHHSIRNLLSHGFCSVYHTTYGDFALEFRKWYRSEGRDSELTRIFRLADLAYEKEQLTHVAQRALILVAEIHAELGLVGP